MNSIRQSKNLSNYSKLSKLADLEDKVSLYELLAMSEDDVKLGKVKSSDEVYDDLIKEIDNYEP